MNAHLSHFRTDSVGYIDSAFADAEVVRKDGVTSLYQPNYGFNIAASNRLALPKLERMFGAANPDASPQARKDAASDFVGSVLKQALSPSEDVVRGMDEPYIFVPGPGRQVVIPSKNVLKPGFRTFSYKVRAPNGAAQWTDPNDMRSLQNADYSVEEKEQGASYFGIAWRINVPEMWEADALGENLAQWREQAATLGLDDFDERVSSYGDADKKIPGFITLGDALVAEGGIRFNSGTPTAEEMILRIGLWETVYRRANRGMKPTAVLAPEADRIAMATKMFTSTGISAWDKASEIYPWLKNATWDDRMLTASSGSLNRWVLYRQAPNDLYLERTPTMVFGPFPEYASQIFILLRRTAGAVSKKPEQVMFVDFTAS